MVKRLFALFALLAFVNTACFSSYRISTSELENLQAGFEAEEVRVDIEGCRSSAGADGAWRVAQEGDEVAMATRADDCTVAVSLGSSIDVLTRDEAYRVTPFNFTLSETQLVAPDYDLLVPRDELIGAEVKEFSTGKTVGLIVGITAVAVGSFLLISLLAPADRGLGGGN